MIVGMSARPRFPLLPAALSLLGIGLALAAVQALRPALASGYLVPGVAASWFGGPLLGFGAAAVSSAASAMAGGFGAEPLARVVMPTLVNMAAAWLVLSLRSAYMRERALLRHHARTGKPFTAAALDLDRFKAVNDQLGHAEGDRVLRAVAETLAGAVRASDLVARCGGDEFSLLLPETDERGAALLLARLRGALFDAMAAGGWQVTFSVGAITFRAATARSVRRPLAGTSGASLPANERDLLQLVDARVYEAKRAGKDRMVHETRGRGVGEPGEPTCHPPV